ncbi:MAG TPA: hypothetical protein VL981_11085 [Candidatus Methylacidiphilales bacterium]|nr:hypothetical protein [Candidatus Methylacidiphilales bacterium]
MNEVPTVSLKIRMEEIDGEKRVNPETMKLLLEFGGHRDVCDECGAVWRDHRGNYCETGRSLLEQVLARPDVEIIKE